MVGRVGDGPGHLTGIDVDGSGGGQIIGADQYVDVQRSAQVLSQGMGWRILESSDDAYAWSQDILGKAGGRGWGRRARVAEIHMGGGVDQNLALQVGFQALQGSLVGSLDDGQHADLRLAGGRRVLHGLNEVQF